MAPVDPQMDPFPPNDNLAILQFIPSKMEGIGYQPWSHVGSP
jgi:hypothetical protein